MLSKPTQLQTKWSITLLSSLGGPGTLMSGSMMAPDLSGHDWRMGDAETNLGLSIFALAFAVGPDIGIGVFGCGVILGTQAIQTFVVDTHLEFTTSAMKLVNILLNTR